MFLSSVGAPDGAGGGCKRDADSGDSGLPFATHPPRSGRASKRVMVPVPPVLLIYSRNRFSVRNLFLLLRVAKPNAGAGFRAANVLH